MIVFDFTLLAEIIGAYIMNESKNFTDTNMLVITGWGFNTNIGSMLSLTVIVPFYFILKIKK